MENKIRVNIISKKKNKNKNKSKNKNKNLNKIILIVVVLIILILICIFVFAKFEISSQRLQISSFDTSDGEDNYNQNDIPKGKIEIKEEELPPQSYSASVPIFMYHFILSDYGNYPDVENFLKPETLEEQIKYIVDNGYETIFIDELDKVYKYTKPVALTFDDCFVYFYNNAYPLIKKYNVKATIYIIYDYMNGENYLTDEQVKEMIDSGLVSVQSHTLTHRELTTLSDEEEIKEIKESKEGLEKDFGIEVTSLAYPVGDYDNDTINETSKNYKFALAMTGGMYYSDIHKDMYKIPRIYANRSMPIETFANYLKQASVEVKW